MDDESRSVKYNNKNEQYLGDYTLVTGWYRSVSPAGGDMPLQAPEVFFCQAVNPVWLQLDTGKLSILIILYVHGNGLVRDEKE